MDKTGKFSENIGRSTDLTEQIIMALSNSVEAKDIYTNGHSRRVAVYARNIARRMGWDDEKCLQTYYAGLLHDVGKIRIPDAIITKAARLTDGEYEEMKLHTIAGYYILKNISAISDFAIGARWHHEKYDGTGYPNGLSGENIPLISRIIGVADAYDAMTSNRSYRTMLSQEQAKAELINGAGSQFDPTIAAIMVDMINEDKDFIMRQPPLNTERRLLAVDDDPMVLKLLNFLLGKDPNISLVTVADGREALSILDRAPFDLVLLDVEMPDMDGFAVLESIRSTDPELPVIFMTGDKDMEIIQKAEGMGVSDYLTKPLVAKMLHESIRNVLKPRIFMHQETL